ncbi:MAG: aminoacyl-tRNA hydrolase [Polyangiales bacterium]
MKLVVGLGNPGPRYEANRHNFGFLLVDHLVDDCGSATWQQAQQGLRAQCSCAGERLICLKPQTYMNRSGFSVQQCAAYFKVAPTDILVVHDELDLPFGVLRLKAGGGLAGHNGLKSIAQQLGRPDFLRLRAGIGRPSRGRVEDYVLSDFTKDEQLQLEEVIDRGLAMIRTWLAEGLAAAMNQHHSS